MKNEFGNKRSEVDPTHLLPNQMKKIVDSPAQRGGYERRVQEPQV